MASFAQLEGRLRRIDGRGYKAYKDIKGAYQEGGLTLMVDHVQGDPFAEPSRVRARLAPQVAGLPAWAYGTDARRVSTADYLNRRLYRAFGGADLRCGSGKSGEVTVLRPGQEVLARSSMVVSPQGEVEARFRVGLPARGRRVLGVAAARLLTEQVPRLVTEALRILPPHIEALRGHLETVDDAQALRQQLTQRGLVAFVGNGAVLPRRSGIDDEPLGEGVVPFAAPEALRVTLSAPHGGQVSGLGIPQGVTLIVGGGYHGKSTLLRALERGVYDHVPGDGRERVVTVPSAVKIRAEDGRRVAGVDISAFINNLPGGQDTRVFSTENASGSTSQAAAIAEALEVEARCLLLDEDTSATNFMIRDGRMQRLVSAGDEPITPFIDRVRELWDQHQVSTVLVVGGSGDYFDVADTVINMRSYRPQDATAEARRIARQMPNQRLDAPPPMGPPRARVPLPRSIDPSRGQREVSIKTDSEDRVRFGTHQVELGAVEQIVERAQTRAMAEALVWARQRALNGERTVLQALREVMEALAGPSGLDTLSAPPRGEFAAFRIYELAAFLNRMRTLQVR